MVGYQLQCVPAYSDCLAELEMNIKFPTCWDGVNVEAQGDTKHVVYATECDGQEHNECFDLDCPASHPVKMPELHLYVRVKDYEGGAHMFSDGSDVSLNKHLNYNYKSTITIFKQADEWGKKGHFRAQKFVSIFVIQSFQKEDGDPKFFPLISNI